MYKNIFNANALIPPPYLELGEIGNLSLNQGSEGSEVFSGGIVCGMVSGQVPLNRGHFSFFSL